MNENKDQIMFAHKLYIKRLDILVFNDIQFHPFNTALYPNDTKEIYVVTVRKVEEGENSPYFGTLEEDGKFDFIYPSIHQTKICFPYDVSFKLYNLTLTEIGKIKQSNDYRDNLPKGWTINDLMKIMIKK